jgi:hypothetical protein
MVKGSNSSEVTVADLLPTVYDTGRFITVFTRACGLSFISNNQVRVWLCRRITLERRIKGMEVNAFALFKCGGSRYILLVNNLRIKYIFTINSRTTQ